ncbi:MAG: hypothetical protein J6Q78_06740 [Clostridia bacterium]|nr:hypothetical protein [Clostridia bacterium]
MKLYNNIGKKIKLLAIVSAIVFALAGYVTGSILMILDDFDSTGWIGLLIMILVPIIAWVSSFVLYGFGELVEKTCNINNILSGGKAEDSERIKRIKRLLAKDLITDEEYQTIFERIKKEEA